MAPAIFSKVLALLLAGAACPLAAELVTFSISAETTPGESIFLTAGHPALGGGSVTAAVKLSPHEYPVWQATFDLPPGIAVTPSFYSRDDAASALADSGNGTLIHTGGPVVVAGGDVREPSHFVVTGSEISTVTIEVDGSANVAMTPADYGGGLLLFEGSLPNPAAAERRSGRISLMGFFLPPSGDIVFPFHDLWWRHGEGFLYEPPHLDGVVAPRVETFLFTPANFDARTIRVLLPRDYDRNTGRRYPVLYAQDGQNVFSPGGPFGSWDLDIIASSLMERGEIPELIVVAIDNSDDRFAEYIPEYAELFGTQGRGGEFLTMIRDDLMPVIDGNYRTLTGAENTGHIGSSLGGLLGFHAGNEFEATFGVVAAMSPSFQVATAENLARAALPPSDWGRIYIDSGTAGSGADGYANTITVRDAMIGAGHAFGGGFGHSVGLGDQHNEAAWRRRLPDVLRWMWQPSWRLFEDEGNSWQYY